MCTFYFSNHSCWTSPGILEKEFAGIFGGRGKKQGIGSLASRDVVFYSVARYQRFTGMVVRGVTKNRGGNKTKGRDYLLVIRYFNPSSLNHLFLFP